MSVQTTHRPGESLTPAVRSLIALGGFGTEVDDEMEYDNSLGDGHRDVAPEVVPVPERVRRLPGALLLTAGYYANRVPALSRVMSRRRDGAE